jgi:hypothetical protein
MGCPGSSELENRREEAPAWRMRLGPIILRDDTDDHAHLSRTTPVGVVRQALLRAAMQVSRRAVRGRPVAAAAVAAVAAANLPQTQPLARQDTASFFPFFFARPVRRRGLFRA